MRIPTMNTPEEQAAYRQKLYDEDEAYLIQKRKLTIEAIKNRTMTKVWYKNLMHFIRDMRWRAKSGCYFNN